MGLPVVRYRKGTQELVLNAEVIAHLDTHYLPPRFVVPIQHIAGASLASIRSALLPPAAAADSRVRLTPMSSPRFSL